MCVCARVQQASRLPWCVCCLLRVSRVIRFCRQTRIRWGKTHFASCTDNMFFGSRAALDYTRMTLHDTSSLQHLYSCEMSLTRFKKPFVTVLTKNRDDTRRKEPHEKYEHGNEFDTIAQRSSGCEKKFGCTTKTKCVRKRHVCLCETRPLYVEPEILRMTSSSHIVEETSETQHRSHDHLT